MPPRGPVGSMGWADRPDTPWALTVPSRAAVAPAARILAPPRQGVDTTTSPRERAMPLWCRRCRFASSFAAKTKCSAASQVLCEHGGGVAGGARLIPPKSGDQGWGPGQRRGRTEARGRGLDPLEGCGGGGAAPDPRRDCARPSRAHTCRCLSFAQQTRATRCSS